MKQSIDSEIEAYEELIEFFLEVASINKDKNLTDTSKRFVENYKEEIAKLKNDNSDDALLEENPDYLKYVNNFFESDYGNVNIRIELQKLLNQLISDLKNPNDKLIEVWVDNYRDFVRHFNLDNDMMYKYMVSVFEKQENGKQYVSKLDEFYNKPKEKKEEVLEDEPIVEDPEDLENKDDHVEDIDTEESDIDLENIPIVENEYNGPIKIVSTKKTHFTRAQKLGAIALCLVTIPNVVTMVPFSMTVLMSFGIYKLAKNFRYRHGGLEKFLRKYDMNISKDGQLIDSEGNVVTEATVGKEKYRLLKRHLMHMGAMENKLINKSYIKDKIISKLIGPVNESIKTKKALKKEEQEKLDSMDYLSRRDEAKIMKKGLGRVR